MSIVIPTYNRGPLILASLQSALDQTFENWEAVVVDDGSTDDTQEVIAGLKDSRIRSFRHPVNRGPAAARNTAIRESRGRFIGLLDSDDTWEPLKLEIQVKQMEQSALQPGVAYSWYTELHTQTGRTRLIQPTLRGEVYRDMLWGPLCSGLTLLMRRDLLLEVGMTDQRINPAYEEWDIMLRLARRTPFELCTESLATHTIHGGPALSKDNLPAARSYEDIFWKHAPEIQRVLGNRGLAYHCDRLARHYAAAGKTACTARYGWRALLHEPRLARALVNGSFVVRSLRPRPDFRGDEF